ncbi:MAG: ABC-2 family transporter protein [Gomphosphaeria aponina SAG 52.96 = DSM 107014]|uniref:ABC-2 family transporter protein n=1 Tax=Gomphosphaeria aponina SAG 52.96 = DSM 107014 TaxID=1521640 RepID=A0A941GXF3_9CHRO|nr:ABC-2 family transporter protein [Gomphosphaeria aponina SAG 52.96 = DSM 107014]
MQWITKKVTTLLGTYYAQMLEYRAEIFLWALSGSLPIILMGVWIEAAQGGKFGLGATDFARYFFSIFLIRQFTNVWVIWEFEREVIEGKLSLRLLQPIDPVWHHVARHLAEKITRVPLVVLLIGLFFLLYPEAFWLPSITGGILTVIATAIAFSLSFLIQYTFSLLAFWTERASAIQQFWYLFYIFLSGLIAPLEVFPPNVRELVEWTPFPYFVHFPASLLVGLPVNFFRAGLVICGWGIFFFVLNRWLWRRGLRQYAGMGA